MKYAVNANEMKSIDDYTVEVLKIPAMVLMERAAKELVAVMNKWIKKTDRILAVCGPGNNGGDGVAAGRILYLQGYHVAILFIGDESKCTDQMKAQLEIAKNLGIAIENSNKLDEYNIIIDAIFGVGLSKPVVGEYEKVIRKINESDNIVFSVDIPSGISADRGTILNAAVKADYTITFGYNKQGLLLYPGADYAGEVYVVDIGFPEIAAASVKPDTFYYDASDLRRMPGRANYSHKGTYGKVLVIAGSKGMCGAAYLSAKAAYRTGAGLVKVVSSSVNRVILQTSLPEALFAAYDEEEYDTDERQKMLLTDLEWASVVIVGPGLGKSQSAAELLETVIRKAKVPVIIDGDAITLLAKKIDHQNFMPDDPTVERRLNYLAELLKEQTIITPHLMELSRILGISVTDISNNMIDTTRQCSYNSKLIYAIKDARTIVTGNETKYINCSGNNGMATGGSGDVLTGIIAALVAQGMLPYEATCLGVYLHGLAGDAASKDKGTYSMMASDILNYIENVLTKIE